MATRKLPWKVGCVYPCPFAQIKEQFVLDRQALAKLSPEVAQLISGELVLTASPEWRALCLYERNRWETLAEKVMQLPSDDRDTRRLQRIMLGNAHWFEAEEPVILPPTLEAFLGIEGRSRKAWILVFDKESSEIWLDKSLVGIAGRAEPEGSRLLRFIRGEEKDHRGRTFDDILAMDDFWLEHTHDFIQWLFPIPEISQANVHAPVLTNEDRVCLRADEALRHQHRRALDRMLSFYGLNRTVEGIVALPGLNMSDHIWLKPAGHNHLRITRIIRSLHYCYQPELALEVQAAFIQFGRSLGQVNEETIGFWLRATD